MNMTKSQEVLCAAGLSLAVAVGTLACSAETRTNPPSTTATMQAMARTILHRYQETPADQRVTGKPPYTAEITIPLQGGKMAVLSEQSATHGAEDMPIADTVDALAVSITPEAPINAIPAVEAGISFTEMNDGSWRAYRQVGTQYTTTSNTALPDVFQTMLSGAQTLVNVTPGQPVPPIATW